MLVLPAHLFGVIHQIFKKFNAIPAATTTAKSNAVATVDAAPAVATAAEKNNQRVERGLRERGGPWALPTDFNMTGRFRFVIGTFRHFMMRMQWAAHSVVVAEGPRVQRW